MTTLAVNSFLMDWSLYLLGLLGVTSLTGFLGLYAAWIAFPPELVVESVVDKSKKFNSESRIKLKNNGKLPALDVQADATEVCAKVAGLTMKDCGFMNGPKLIPRLAGGESAELSVSPCIHFCNAVQISAFSYRLTLKYCAKLFLFERSLSKTWTVELRNFEDGFSWHVTPAD
jgi:hypothetical protein